MHLLSTITLYTKNFLCNNLSSQHVPNRQGKSGACHVHQTLAVPSGYASIRTLVTSGFSISGANTCFHMGARARSSTSQSRTHSAADKCTAMIGIACKGWQIEPISFTGLICSTHAELEGFSRLFVLRQIGAC